MLNRTVGVGRGCLNYPERPQLCASRVACRENPTEPLCVCVWGGGVTNSFLSPSKGDPPSHKAPLLKPEPWALSLTTLFCQLPHPIPAS